MVTTINSLSSDDRDKLINAITQAYYAEKNVLVNPKGIESELGTVTLEALMELNRKELNNSPILRNAIDEVMAKSSDVSYRTSDSLRGAQKSLAMASNNQIAAAYNANPEIIIPDAKSVSDFEDRYKLRNVRGEVPKLTLKEKWSIVADGKRTLFDSESEAVDMAKRRVKDCLLYHHIQEIDANGVVQHAEDRYIGTIGYIDKNTKERAIFTPTPASFASADVKGRKASIIRRKVKKGSSNSNIRKKTGGR